MFSLIISLLIPSKKSENDFLLGRKGFPSLPPLDVNSSGSTLTPSRGLIALGLLMDFLRVHHCCICLISIIILYGMTTDRFFA